ncbi:16034_t:CDS:2 [Entrophospora sp. SA101]|nr:16034_t:CDS:2 [Entrophospora sp. SA101]
MPLPPSSINNNKNQQQQSPLQKKRLPLPSHQMNRIDRKGKGKLNLDSDPNNSKI